VLIAQFAHDAHVKASTPIGHQKGCGNETATVGGDQVGTAKEVLSLGAASRRIRAVLIHAGFFSNITLQLDADHLFATSIVATDGFLENVN
jgi:hypothetical protein